MRRRSMGGLLLGLFVGVGTSCGSSSSDSGDSGSTADTTTSTEGSTQTSNTVTTGNVTSSSSATASTATTSAGGSGGSSSDASTTTATSTTGDGGSAGDASVTSVTSNTTSTSAGGSGGAPDGPCPDQPPIGNTPCPGLGAHCAYEDCAGAGRTVATCSQGTWFVETGACTDMVYCSGGSEICSAGELCLIMAGGALLQECIPNTCEDEAVTCDCTEGCSGNCTTFASAETGITITCDTCPNDLCP